MHTQAQVKKQPATSDDVPSKPLDFKYEGHLGSSRQESRKHNFKVISVRLCRRKAPQPRVVGHCYVARGQEADKKRLRTEKLTATTLWPTISAKLSRTP